MEKKARQKAIAQIIASTQIETQDELAKRLQQEGYQVTQATVSRDIREMKLTKTQAIDGHQHYISALQTADDDKTSVRSQRVLKEAFISAEQAQNILVIKTVSGMAMAVAASLDAINFSEIVGSIAGDDTIFCVTKTNEEAHVLKMRLLELVHK